MNRQRVPLFFILLLLLAPCPVSAQVRPAAGSRARAAYSAERTYPRLGISITETKHMDLQTGALTREARDRSGNLVDPLALEAAENRLRTAADKLDPLLTGMLAARAGPRPVGVWLRFDPADVDHRQEFRGMLRAGIPKEVARAELRSRVAFGNSRVMSRAIPAIEGLGLEVLYADEFAPLIVTSGDRAALLALAGLEVVDRIYATLEGHPMLPSAVATHRWDRVFDFGVRGDGVLIAIVEDGGVSTVGTSINVVASLHPGVNTGNHATMVAGIAAGDDATRPGHARGAGIISANFLASPTWGDIIVAGTWSINQGAEILNMSFGGDSNRTLTIADRYYDYIVRYNSVTATIAAGNFGAGSGNVAWPALGWNVISVGNVNDGNTSDWVGDTMAHDSSFKNPISTYNDRTKPELSAVGSNIDVLGMGGALWNSSGTSNSAPAIAGMVACLLQADPNLGASPEAVKAVMMAAATENIEGVSRLSDKDGAGSINGLQAYRMVEQDQFESGTFTAGTFAASNHYATSIHLRGGDTTRVVLCWDSNASATYSTDTLDADFDLAILQGQGATSGTLLTASTSFDNSYEIVEFCPPATGWYTIRVTKYRFDGTSEPYGLAWTQHADGRHSRLRPHLPDVEATDLCGPVIGNTNFVLDPFDGVNPGDGYLSIASLGTSAGIPVPGCRQWPIDLDLVTFLFSAPGNPWFMDFAGTLNGGGAAPTNRMSIPDIPTLVGAPLYFGMVTLDPAALGGIKELSRVQEVLLEGHSDVMNLSDDGFVGLNLAMGFPFFGTTYTHCYVNANGNLTFGAGDPAYSESVAGLTSGLPRIAPFWDDLDPTLGGKMRARSGGNRIIVEWVNVRELGTTTENSVLVVLHASGKIEFMYRDCALTDAIVGISPGGNAATYPVDLSHGSRTPINPGTPPAIYEEFNSSNPFDLGIPDDRRNVVTFTPTNGTYRVTVDMR